MRVVIRPGEQVMAGVILYALAGGAVWAVSLFAYAQLRYIYGWEMLRVLSPIFGGR